MTCKVSLVRVGTNKKMQRSYTRAVAQPSRQRNIKLPQSRGLQRWPHSSQGHWLVSRKMEETWMTWPWETLAGSPNFWNHVLSLIHLTLPILSPWVCIDCWWVLLSRLLMCLGQASPGAFLHSQVQLLYHCGLNEKCLPGPMRSRFRFHLMHSYKWGNL